MWANGTGREKGQGKGPKAWKCRLNVEQGSIPAGSPKTNGKTEQYLKPEKADYLKRSIWMPTEAT